MKIIPVGKQTPSSHLKHLAVRANWHLRRSCPAIIKVLEETNTYFTTNDFEPPGYRIWFPVLVAGIVATQTCTDINKGRISVPRTHHMGVDVGRGMKARTSETYLAVSTASPISSCEPRSKLQHVQFYTQSRLRYFIINWQEVNYTIIAWNMLHIYAQSATFHTMSALY